ncbi:hypothetical protein [Embleya sp. NPDC020630]|uniref:hypothetical protein n=1 Tax=Embleya sp. NPDC020630 TaxID=3363979 RepID=UPI00378C426B
MANSRIVRIAALACSAGLSAAFLALPSASADVNQCGNLIICIDIRVPGASSSGSTGGGTTGGSAAGGSNGGSPGFTTGGSAITTGGVIAGAAGGGGNQQPPPPAPADVALMALAQLKLERPEIEVTPPGGKLGLVGLPVWMWLRAPAANVWSPTWISKELTVGTVTVTAHARSTRVEWDMGDGNKVPCDGPGRPYQPSDANDMGPCSHKYLKTSKDKDGDKFTITATVFWEANYTDAAGTHPLPGMTGANTTTVRIGELQVIN